MAKPEGDNWHYAVELTTLEDREPYPVDLNGKEIAIVKLDDDIFAVSNVCTHEYACLSDGHIEEDRIVCMLHLAEFHIPTGKAVEEPAVEDLETFPIAIDSNEVYVQVA